MPPAVRASLPVDQKLARLGQAAAFDLSCACGTDPSRVRGDDGRWIYPAALPSGQRVPMLKVLQQAGCERGCAYCAQRHGGLSQDPLSLSPDELARLFADLYAQRQVFGLFLSSAIRGGAVATMDRVLATAEILRGRLRYRGYLHLKILPGCEAAQVTRAMQLATRVSVNMEAPTALHLSRIAPAKSFDEQIVAPMRQVAQAVAQRRQRTSQTTQLVVGAADETDRDIGRAAAWLYSSLRLARVYYSAFQPVTGTPLADRAPAPFMREHRLYQMDFLLRCYGFELRELAFDDQGQLPLHADPKTLWARANPAWFPLEVNTASPAQLVRVPGVGPRSAERIVRLRRQGRIRSLEAVAAAGASWRIAAPYLLLDGRQPAVARQLDLFE